MPPRAARRTQRSSEIDQERHREKRCADREQQEQVLGEIRVDAQAHAREHRGELLLLLSVDEVAHAEGAGDRADEEPAPGGPASAASRGSPSRALSATAAFASLRARAAGMP